MENRSQIITILLSLTIITLSSAQNKNKDLDRGYAFDGRSSVTSLSTGFFGDSYGYGKISGVPLLLSFEYGIHRYVGASIYGGMLQRDPIFGEKRYQLDVYTVGARFNFHLYNLVDDLLKLNLRGDIVDVYGSFSVGMDHYDTNLPVQTKFSYYITGGAGIRAYPIKKARGLGFNMEFSTILSPWLIGLNYRF